MKRPKVVIKGLGALLIFFWLGALIAGFIAFRLGYILAGDCPEVREPGIHIRESGWIPSK